MIALVLYKHIHRIVFTVGWRDVKESRVRIPDDCCCISISYEYDGIFPSVYDGDIYTSDTSMHILLTLSYVVKISI